MHGKWGDARNHPRSKGEMQIGSNATRGKAEMGGGEKTYFGMIDGLR
jgi:hypothetical protein